MPQHLVSLLLVSIILFLILSVIIGMIHWKNLSLAIRFLIGYLAWNLLIELVTYLIPPGTNNLPLLHLYTFLEFILFAFIYRYLKIFDRIGYRGFQIGLFSCASLLILNSIFVEEIYDYNSLAKAFVQIFLISCAIIYFFRLDTTNVRKTSADLLNAGVLIFYSGSLFIFMFGNLLLENEYMSLFWDVNLVLNVIFQILMLATVWKASQEGRNQSA